jgi:hypothetical protein
LNYGHRHRRWRYFCMLCFWIPFTPMQFNYKDVSVSYCHRNLTHYSNSLMDGHLLNIVSIANVIYRTIDFVLSSAVDGSSQQQRKQLSPADLLSFARQTATGMVSSCNSKYWSILWWVGEKINEVYIQVLTNKHMHSHPLQHFVQLQKGLVTISKHLLTDWSTGWLSYIDRCLSESSFLTYWI